MKIQEIVSDVRNRVGTAGRNYQDAFKAYFDAQRKAVGVVTKNGQTLANTEIGAAKNIFAAAKSSFDKARTDGVRKIANNPQAYVPNGRDQIVSAYKDTIDLLVQTTNELSNVVTSGYKSVIGKLSGDTSKKASATRKRSASSSRKTASAKKATTSASSKTAASKTTATKRKTASTRKSTASASNAKSGTATARKRTTKKASAPAPSAAAEATPGSTDSNAS
ncbi:hypothetical protein [Salinisphaera shabanensis]|uniref:hypothetical protein n=1 Tax=Salinisphaera shabanensis TaxID=180542 RepID=UPI0033411674